MGRPRKSALRDGRAFKCKGGNLDSAALILADSQIISAARCGAAAQVPWDHARGVRELPPIRIIAARA
jgi:hypothetical protein